MEINGIDSVLGKARHGEEKAGQKAKAKAGKEGERGVHEGMSVKKAVAVTVVLWEVLCWGWGGHQGVHRGAQQEAMLGPAPAHLLCPAAALWTSRWQTVCFLGAVAKVVEAWCGQQKAR